jgi:hypothetical protein
VVKRQKLVFKLGNPNPLRTSSPFEREVFTVSMTNSMRREDSNLEMPRRSLMELIRWFLVRVMDACSWEKKLSVLNGLLFLCLRHVDLSSERYFVQALWSTKENFFLDQAKEVPNPLRGEQQGLIG